MYARSFFLGATWFLSRLAAPVSAGLYPEDAVDRLAALGLNNLEHHLNNQSSTGKCTLETAVKRREWYALSRGLQDHPSFTDCLILSRSDLSVPEREDYIKAVLCLQSLPARHDSKAVPGAKSRFDDFVAVHINLTTSVHGTVRSSLSHSITPLHALPVHSLTRPGELPGLASGLSLVV
jgi:tyrosinase